MYNERILHQGRSGMFHTSASLMNQYLALESEHESFPPMPLLAYKYLHQPWGRTGSHIQWELENHHKGCTSLKDTGYGFEQEHLMHIDL